MKIFCFSHAGGNANFYDDLKNEMVTSGIEMIALDYPGHGSRKKEPFMDNFDGLSDDMISKMRYLINGDDYALMGYSMGSIVATDIMRKILDINDLCIPKHIFLAAHEPKTHNILADLSSEVCDNVIKERTISFGAVPEELVNNKTFWRIYLPLYKADYGLIKNYDFEALQLITNVSATVFYSEEDTPFKEIAKWSNYYKGNTKYFQLNGNHFFIKNHIKEIADIIFRRLSEVD